MAFTGGEMHIMSSTRRRLSAVAVVAAVAVSLAGCGEESGGQDTATVRVGVGGKALLVYLPTTLAEQLGYFTDEGLQVEFDDLEGGSQALQALQGGSVDVVNGYYE